MIVLYITKTFPRTPVYNNLIYLGGHFYFSCYHIIQFCICSKEIIHIVHVAVDKEGPQAGEESKRMYHTCVAGLLPRQLNSNVLSLKI